MSENTISQVSARPSYPFYFNAACADVNDNYIHSPGIKDRIRTNIIWWIIWSWRVAITFLRQRSGCMAVAKPIELFVFLGCTSDNGTLHVQLYHRFVFFMLPVSCTIFASVQALKPRQILIGKKTAPDKKWARGTVELRSLPELERLCCWTTWLAWLAIPCCETFWYSVPS